MKEFEAGKWSVSEWGEVEPDCVVVRWPGAGDDWFEIRNELDIEWKLGSELVPSGVAEAVRAELAKGPKCRPKLAENQVWRDWPLPMAIDLRWHNGVAQNRRAADETNWTDWKWGRGSDWENRAEDWFRANCPIDRFVTDEGEVLEFRMTDDGEAQSFYANGEAHRPPTFATHTERDPVETWRRALYRFRDHERGKWTVSSSEDGRTGEMRRLDSHRTFIHRKGDSCLRWFTATYIKPDEVTPPEWAFQMMLAEMREAEALYREKNLEWRVEWNGSSKCVDIRRNGKLFCAIYKDGTPNNVDQVPPHILTQARAKFRENYVLKSDEIWYQGMPMKLAYVAGECPVKLGNTGANWRPNRDREEWLKFSSSEVKFADEAERLAAYDKCREFYYEEHPGKCLSEIGRPVRFELQGNVGAALNEYDCALLYSTDTDPNNCRPAMLEKLRAWTAEQLKKREGEKVVFEGKVVESNYLWTLENGDKIQSAELLCTDGSKMLLQEVKLSNSVLRDTCLNGGFLRVTIEALGDG